jgi:hypothetical protein
MAGAVAAVGGAGAAAGGANVALDAAGKPIRGKARGRKKRK